VSKLDVGVGEPTIAADPARVDWQTAGIRLCVRALTVTIVLCSRRTAALMAVGEMDETFVLLLLADSNLPTGSFVASSGFESHTTHGFLSLAPTKTDGTLAFVRDSLHSYAHSALAFTSDAHAIVATLAQSGQDTQQALASLTALDALYESMTVNHVARRASTAQGTALLTLYAKAFSSTRSSSSTVIVTLVDQLKLAVRRGDSHGHLPVCWGVLTAALGLSLGPCVVLTLVQSIILLSSDFRPCTASGIIPSCAFHPLCGRAFEHYRTIPCSADVTDGHTTARRWLSDRVLQFAIRSPSATCGLQQTRAERDGFGS